MWPWKRIISIIFVLNILTVTAFAHSAALETGDPATRYKAIRLTPQIYNAANSDLSDILVKDGNGENVPYFINTGLQSTGNIRETYPMDLIDSYTKEDSFYFDYKLAAVPDRDIVATSIDVTTQNTNFAKPVDVYGSHDGLHWELLQNDKLYSVDSHAKLTIELEKPQKYIYYRFKLANNLEKISLDAVSLIYNVETSEKTYFVEQLAPIFYVEDKDKRTYINIEGLKNLRLCNITIETDGMFKRTVTAPAGASKELYKLAVNDISYSDTTIPLDWQVSQDEVYTVSIANNDDKPINITGITVRYYVDMIVFESNPNETYTLEFGADASKIAPVYDVARYKDEILKGAVDTVQILDVSYDEEPAPPGERNYTFIFNIVVILIAVLLGALILLRLKRN